MTAITCTLCAAYTSTGFPFPTVLGVLGLGALLQRVCEGEWSTAEVTFALIGTCLLAEQAPFIKNVRYMLTLELPLRFLALALSFRVAQRLWPTGNYLIVAGAVSGMCVLDWQTFRLIFADPKGYDPLSLYLLRAREIIPPY